MDEKLSDIWIRYCLSKYSEAFKFHSYFSDYFIVRFFLYLPTPERIDGFHTTLLLVK